MSTTFPLPQELLETIIGTLGRLHGNGSVATMLRVNKYVCSVTLPILYGTVPALVLNQSYPKDSPAFKRRQKLIATLLLGVPKTRISDLVRVTFLQDPVDDQEHPPAPYAPYHSFAIAIFLGNCNDAFDGDFSRFEGSRGVFFLNGAPSQRLLDFVEDHKLMDRYITEAPLAKLSYVSHWTILTDAINRELRRDLTWALCSNMERLKYFEIPLSDIDRYLPLVDKFKALSKVWFELDRRLFPTRIDLNELELTPEQRTILNHQRAERKRHLDQMLLFVQGLRHHHGSVLQTATCSGERPHLGDKCPEEYEEQLAGLLSPLPNPKTLNINNWGHFATKVKETNLSAVESIMPLQDEQGALSLPRLLEQSPFLHRCRSLQSISLTSFTDDVFQWAVDERMQHDADIATGRSPQRPLVPLREVKVYNDRSTDGRLINDIGYCFGETLQYLEARPHFSYGTHPDDIIPDPVECLVGGLPSLPCWHAPLLSDLAIFTYRNTLRIHPSLFAQCPQLKSIQLSDKRQRYSSSDIIRYEPTELGKLESLMLQGSPALSFCPTVLRNTPELNSLTLRMAHNNMPSYIPPVAELEEPGEELEDDPEKLAPTTAATTPNPPGRPIWTWDWDLPKLTNLELTSEFAYRFQFKLLRSTPSLERFLVDTRSLSGQHKRTLCVKDLLQNAQESTAVDDTQNDDNDDDTLNLLQSQYIHLSNLTDFSLIGDWTLDRRVLTILCRKVLPKNLRDLSLRGCSGFGFHDWVKTTSKHLSNLQTATASCEVTPESASEVGLILKWNNRDAEGRLWCTRVNRSPEDTTDNAKTIFWFHSIDNVE